MSLLSTVRRHRRRLTRLVIGLAAVEAAVLVVRMLPPAPIRGTTTVANNASEWSRARLDVSQAALTAADTNSKDWLYATHDYSGQRFSPLAQINSENVTNLKVACTLALGDPPSFQTNPIVVDGMMYVTTVTATIAMDAGTCAERWRHERIPRQWSPWRNNRGVAVKDGLVVRGTNDGILIALDARSGREVWQRRVANLSRGETITMPPLIYDDLIILGPAGGEYVIAGWVGAFRLRDGKQVWRFPTILRGETWRTSRGVAVGGGSVWTPMTLDATTGTLFVATTNPAPDLIGEVRGGANLYTNSVLALNVRTGKLRWYRQLIPHDTHDWDLTHAGPLFDANVHGAHRPLIAAVGKDGIFRALDRETHEVVFQTAVSRRMNTEAAISTSGTYVCPGINGGVLWNGAAFSRIDKSLLVPSVDFCGTYTRAKVIRSKPGSDATGGTFSGDASTWSGALTAIDASDGSVRWRYDSKDPIVASVTATAGSLVFFGDVAGSFLALDSRTGKVRYRLDLGGGIGGGVVTYLVRGRQSVAVMSGSASSIFPILRRGSARVTVLTLP
jgi:alcohol dehydrogenase (cytochrome c)